MELELWGALRIMGAPGRRLGWPGAPSLPGTTLPRVYMDKNVSRAVMRCPSQGLTRLKPFTREKVGSPPRVTLSCQPSDPTPRITLPPEPGLQFLV